MQEIAANHPDRRYYTLGISQNTYMHKITKAGRGPKKNSRIGTLNSKYISMDIRVQLHTERNISFL